MCGEGGQAGGSRAQHLVRGGQGCHRPRFGLSHPLVATGRSAGRGLSGRHRSWQHPSGLGDLVFSRSPMTPLKINAEQLFSNYVFSLVCSKNMDRQQMPCGPEDLGARSPQLLMECDPWSWFYRELGRRDPEQQALFWTLQGCP